MSDSSNRTRTLAAFIAIFVVSVVMVYLTVERRKGVGSVSQKTIFTQALPPGTGHSKTTRKKGGRFSCTVVGRLDGTMTQQAKVEVGIPILESQIRSTWIGPWMMSYTAEVLRNDDTLAHERRTLKNVRSIELLAPANYTRLNNKFGDDLDDAIIGAAATLKGVTRGSSGRVGMVLIQSQDLDYTGISHITGIDETVLKKQHVMLTGTANILSDVEGKTVELRMHDGQAEWMCGANLPEKVVHTLGQMNTLVDYTALPDPKLAVGQQTTLSAIMVNVMFPPDLVGDWFGEVDTDLTLNLTRREDQTKDGRTHSVFDGDGILHFVPIDEKEPITVNVQSASLLVDRTDTNNRFLHELQLATPIDTRILKKRALYRDVEWDGDVNLRVRYRVNLEKS